MFDHHICAWIDWALILFLAVVSLKKINVSCQSCALMVYASWIWLSLIIVCCSICNKKSLYRWHWFCWRVRGDGGGVANDRPGNWSCDLRATKRPKKIAWGMDRQIDIATSLLTRSRGLSQSKLDVTCNMWHKLEICDIWHVTHDKWHVTHGGRWIFSQNVTSLAHTVEGDMKIWKKRITEWII